MTFTYEPANIYKWTDYGWENDIFHLFLGDFLDDDGDDFYISVEYLKKFDVYIFSMVYDGVEVVYDRGDEFEDIYFEYYISKELMENILNMAIYLMSQ